MDIKIGKFVLQQASGSVEKFDLIESIQREKKGTGAKYAAEKDIAFGMSLERALQYIIYLNLAENKEVVTLEEFLTRYMSERDKLIKLINKVTTILKK